MGAGGDGLFQKILVAPEGLAPVDHGLDCAQGEEEDGRSEYKPVRCPYGVVDLLHPVVDNADAGLHSRRSSGRLDVCEVQLEQRDLMPRFPHGFERLLEQEVGVPVDTGPPKNATTFITMVLILP